MAADGSYNPGRIQLRQDGSLYVPSGAYIYAESGAIVDIQSGANFKIASTAIPHAVTIGTPVAPSANVTEIAITVVDGAGTAIAGVFNLDVWLSDSADGAGLTATTASGAVAAKTSSGVDLSVMVAKKATRVQTLATGIYTLSITDTAKTAFKVCAQCGVAKATPRTLTTADYG